MRQTTQGDKAVLFTTRPVLRRCSMPRDEHALSRIDYQQFGQP
jgi:hypothetical protein